MKQATYNHINQCNNNVIYPIYKDQGICDPIIQQLKYDVNLVVDKSFNKITTIYTLGNYPFESFTFIGLGDSKDITTMKLKQAFQNVSKQVKADATFVASKAVANNISVHEIARLFVETYLLSTYTEQKLYKEEKKTVYNIDILAHDEDVSKDIEMGMIYGNAINYAKSLSDTPYNYLNANDLVEKAVSMAEEFNIKYQVLDKQKLQDMGAGAILAVNKGSEIPPYLICLDYHNGGDQEYKAVVGKGITFDSGGYNLKPSSYGMKYDMSGAADVLGIMQILAASKAKTNVYGIMPITDNLINEKAYKPQDVIQSLSKQTIEIVSTDAEGRLLLADALTYAQQLGAKKIIDLATLTGACIRALGNDYTGIFANDDTFFHEFNQSCKECDEKGWRLPLDECFAKMLESTSADFKNSAGSPIAGASVAGSFLNKFINEGTQWIHLDIAGTAEIKNQATGVMIKSVAHFFSK